MPAGAGGEQLRRRYSLAAWEASPREYQLGIRCVEGGRVSAWLHAHAHPGSEVEVPPPAGEFVLQRRGGDVVLVAGGIGLTPMAAMVDALRARCGANTQVWLFHAARNRAELVDYARYADLGRSRPGFHYRPFLSAPHAEWSGGRGRLDVDLLMRELATPAAAQYYLCASREMMEQLAQGLTAAGVPPSAVHWESFGAAGANADMTKYRVSIAGHGSHAFRGEPSLLHALEAWGVPVKAECRTGSCGACRVAVRNGQMRLCQTQEVEVPPGSVLACCAVPESDIEIVL